MATVEIRGVRKTYPGAAQETIKGIDCRIADGEFLVMLGPSGCGKSTLLRMVAGLESIGAGEISIGERVVNRLEPKDRNIAMVFQNYALYPHMSVYDNMAYGLRIQGLSKADIDTRVRQAAQTLELSALLERKPRQLSGGQRQRVAMGRAIVREPAVFLFDEPLSNLDAKLRTQMRIEIKRLQSRLGVTSLYVTHDQVEAMTLADRIMVMNGGAAEQIAPPLEVYLRPASMFVAGFIGSPAMNFLAATVTADGTGITLPGGQRVATKRATGLAGRKVVAGIRPEHMALDGPTDPEHRLSIEVELVEALGADTVVHGRLGDGVALLARLPGVAPVRDGDRLALGVAEDQLHLFDPDTGRALG
ncbi:sn-glycerol 3-phosphate transport system ATP-binding protein [Inquilinus ginsengisoli]|uniref:Sn-glycerol 3-phosphate transport system ATP-binding protein n=1 Tax=Inquilinus ginsengisoli TaxID=363840 RepID=A0ABU1JV62_9PROT|nr:sn-glycerol-3-phosphate import ATP-binding protein UgpC [Inquilinus ginsengisoli]MDR6292517.1 sn-glycerol 3-phosphate transport system ATP-binding protein [Inquilinus ginsengisoli]